MNDLRNIWAKILDIAQLILAICVLIGLLIGIYLKVSHILAIVFTIVTVVLFLLELLLPDPDEDMEEK